MGSTLYRFVFVMFSRDNWAWWRDANIIWETVVLVSWLWIGRFSWLPHILNRHQFSRRWIRQDKTAFYLPKWSSHHFKTRIWFEILLAYCLEKFQFGRPRQILLLALKIQMRRLMMSRLIKIDTVCHSALDLQLSPFGRNGCVQIIT